MRWPPARRCSGKPVAESAPVFLPYRWSQGGGARTFPVRPTDLNHDTDALAERWEVPAGYVINCRAEHGGGGWLHPEHCYQTNVVANVRLHDRLRRFQWLKRYVHVSTPGLRKLPGQRDRGRPWPEHALCRLPGRLRSPSPDVLQAVRFSSRFHAGRERVRPRPATVPHHSPNHPVRPYGAAAAIARRRAFGPLVHPHPGCGRRHLAGGPAGGWGRCTTWRRG
jgi:hypothetical protein